MITTAVLFDSGAVWVRLAGQFTGRLRKAVGYGMILEGETPEDKLRVAKDAGFEGVEISTALRMKTKTFEPKNVAKASEKSNRVVINTERVFEPRVRRTGINECYHPELADRSESPHRCGVKDATDTTRNGNVLIGRQSDERTGSIQRSDFREHRC